VCRAREPRGPGTRASKEKPKTGAGPGPEHATSPGDYATREYFASGTVSLTQEYTERHAGPNVVFVTSLI